LSTTENLTRDLAASMKSGDTMTTGTLRLIRGAIKNEEIKLGHPLEEPEVMKVLQKEAKQRRDSIEAFSKAGRTDLADRERLELEVIGKYLPAAMSEDELRMIVDEVCSAQGATEMKQMGSVVGAVMKQVGARADGGTVARLVREKLGA
jgi:uncharacterized protein YqeY